MNFRLATPEDAAQIQAIYAPFCRTHTSFEAEPPSVEEIARRIASGLQRYPWVVAGEDGTLAGYCYASSHRERAAYRWSVEATIYLHEDFRGRGLGKALMTSLLALLRLQRYVSVYGGVALPNPASVALQESLGFERIGVYAQAGYKAGDWWDVLWLQYRLHERPPDPREPLTPAELMHTPEWQRAMESGLAQLRG